MNSRTKRQEGLGGSDKTQDPAAAAIKPLIDIIATPEGSAVFQDELGRLYHAGDQTQLFEMIDYCAAFGWPLPEWAAKAFRQKYDSIRKGRARSFDEAFGRPYSKNAKRTARQSELKSMRIFARVRELHDDQGIPIDEGMFERVSREFGLGRTRCKEIYYQAERMLRPLWEAGLSPFRELRKVSNKD